MAGVVSANYITGAYHPENASYGFFTREGGVSEDKIIAPQKEGDKPILAAFSSLNVGVATEDAAERVVQNIKIAYDKTRVNTGKPLDASSWLFINETTYSNKVLTITDGNIEALKAQYARKADDKYVALNDFCTRIPADGFVTTSKNVVLAAVGADAHTIVLIDDKTGVAGVMAGSWKGLAKGLYENMVEQMVGLGSKREDIVTIVGPGLARENYEFGAGRHQSRPKDETKPGNADSSGVFYDREFLAQCIAEDAAKAEASGMARDEELSKYRPNSAYAQFFPLRDKDKDGNPVADPQKCDVDILGLLQFKAQEQGLGTVYVDCAVNNRTDERFFSARYATEKAFGVADSSKHKAITGRNFNFVSLVDKSKPEREV